MDLPVRSKTVLVVDNDLAVLEDMRRSLTRGEFEVTTAQRVTEAQSKMHEQKFDLVVSDKDMPHVDGMEFFRWIRQHFLGEQPELIMVSGDFDDPSDNPSIHELTSSLKANYLGKPFLPSVLIEMARSAVLQRATPST